MILKLMNILLSLLLVSHTIPSVAFAQGVVDDAENKVKAGETSGQIAGQQKVSPNIISLALSMAGLAVGIEAIKMLPSCPNAYSGYALAGGAVATAAGEMLSALQYKSKIKKIQKELEALAARSKEKEATNLQAEVFDTLMKREDATISAGKLKKNLYIVSSAAYSAAIGLAIWEIAMSQIPITGQAFLLASTCKKKAYDEAKKEEARLEAEYASKAPVEAAPSGIVIPPELVAVVDPIKMSLRELLTLPMTRLALASVFLTNNMFMVKYISGQIEKAQKRKEFIQKLKDQVTPGGNSIAIGGGNGSTNTDGMAAVSIQNTSGGLAASHYGLAGSSENLESGSPTSCFTSAGQFDGSCSCRNNNSCFALNANWAGSGFQAPAVLSGELPNLINSINNGTMSGSNIDSGMVENLGARARRFTEQALSNPKNKALAAQAKKSEEDSKALMTRLSSNLASSPSLANASMPSFFGNSAKADESDVKKMEDSIKQEINKIKAGEAFTNSSPVRPEDEIVLDAMGSEAIGGVTAQDSKLAEVMANEYEMGEGDINNQNGPSLFEILSNRYKKSGFQRLDLLRPPPAQPSNSK